MLLSLVSDLEKKTVSCESNFFVQNSSTNARDIAIKQVLFFASPRIYEDLAKRTPVSQISYMVADSNKSSTLDLAQESNCNILPNKLRIFKTRQTREDLRHSMKTLAPAISEYNYARNIELKISCKMTAAASKAPVYLLKVNNRNTSKRCKTCSKLTIKIGVVLVSLLLTLNLFDTLFQCF